MVRMGMYSHHRVTSCLLAGVLAVASLSATAAGDTRLLEAAKAQRWQTVRDLVDVGKVDVNVTQPDGATALTWVAHWDQVGAARRLLQAGADPDIGNDYGVTPLFLATKNRSPEMVATLLEGGADPNASLWSGVTPLMGAARTGSLEVMNLLLDHGADINAREPRRQQNALMWAISFGHSGAARLLIEAGAEVHASTARLNDEYSAMELEGYAANVLGTPQGGYTALMFAARVGDMATVQQLIQAGADVNAISETDGPPLVIAAAYGHESLALYLLEQGAAPNIADDNGMTPLHYTMRDGLKVLHGYSIADAIQVCGFGGDDTRCKPLSVLSEDEQELLAHPTGDLYEVEPEVNPDEPLPGGNMHNLAEALLVAGANPDAEMKFPPPHLRLARLSWVNLAGATPMFLAAAAQDTTAMEMLLEEGARPLVKTSINEDVFYIQTNNYADDNQIIGNATTLMVLVGMGRKSDFSPAEEQRALQGARKLVELGADVNATTATGWTALHAAAFIGAETLIRFLVENGARINVKNACGQTPMSLALGTSVAGLLDRTVPQIETAELLLELGAAEAPEYGPAGQCVLGRGGLEADAAQNELVEQRIQQVQQKLQRNR